MNKLIAPEGVIHKYKVIRVSTGSITEVAYVTAKDEEEAEEKLSRDELDRDFELVEDDMHLQNSSHTLAASEMVDELQRFLRQQVLQPLELYRACPKGWYPRPAE